MHALSPARTKTPSSRCTLHTPCLGSRKKAAGFHNCTRGNCSSSSWDAVDEPAVYLKLVFNINAGYDRDASATERDNGFEAAPVAYKGWFYWCVAIPLNPRTKAPSEI